MIHFCCGGCRRVALCWVSREDAIRSTDAGVLHHSLVGCAGVLNFEDFIRDVVDVQQLDVRRCHEPAHGG